jgi:Domain of unknown function (DUF1707)
VTEPADEMAVGAAGGGRLRASYADREQVIDVLKAAFVQAQLTKDEFDARVGQAFASRTYAELAVITAGIPALPTGAQPSRHPVRARVRHRVNPDLRSDVRVILTACPIAAVSWLATVPAGDNFVTMPLFLLVAFTATVAALRSFVHGAMVLVESWLQKRSRWHPLPPPPEPGEWLLTINAGRLGPHLAGSILG